jgi:hypothetical protein
MTNKIEFIITAKDAASKVVKKNSKELVEFTKVGAKATVAIAAAGAAVVGFTTKMAGLVREAEILADTAGLSVETYNEMAHAANMAGISNEQLSDQLKDVNDKVGDFLTTGGGPLVDFFEKIAPKVGVTADQFRNLNSADALQLYVSSLEKANVSQAEMTFFMEAIANDATKLIPLFENQGAAMAAAANDAAFLGVTMSDELVAKSKNVRDGMDRAGKALKGFGLSIAEEIMPLLAPAANGFADMVANIRKSAANLLKNTINVFAGMHQVFRQWNTNLIDFVMGGDTFQVFVDGFIGMGKGVAKAISNMGDVIMGSIKITFDASREIISRFGEWAFNAIKAIFSREPVADFPDVLGSVVSDAMARIYDLSSTGFEAFKHNGSAAAEALKGSLDGFKFSVTEAFDEGVEKVERMREVSIESAQAVKDNNTDLVTNTLDMMFLLDEGWTNFYKGLEDKNKQFSVSLTNLMNATVNGFSKAFATAIVAGKSLTDSLKGLAKSVLTEFVAMLVKLGIQHFIMTKIMGKASGGKIGAEIYGNAFAATAAIPIVGPALAPGVAAASLATGLAGMAASSGAGAATAVAGIAHGGLENVPSESTFLLDKGERVLSPRQNTDLTTFLQSQGSASNDGRSIVIEQVNIEVLPNATSASALLEMDRNEIKEVVAGPLIQALNDLDDEGVRPNFVERQAI